MGLLDVVKGWISNEDGETLDSSNTAGQFKTRRFHIRYKIIEPSLFHISIAGRGRFRVVDISYNGCLIEPEGTTNLDAVLVPVSGCFELLGLNIPVQVIDVQKRRSGWGLRLDLPNEDTIIRIGKVIEPLRCGSSAIPVSEDIHSHQLTKGLQKRFTGDGPFDLVYERDANGGVVLGMVTLRVGDVYSSVIWENGTVITKKNADKIGVGARMAQTVIPDREIIVTAAIACLGMNVYEGGHMARLLRDSIKPTS
jgi:hypothetical protein